MGDTGSLALGGLIGYIAIVIRQEFMLFFVGGIFVIEALSVMMQVSYFKYTRRRYGEGRRIFLMRPAAPSFPAKGLDRIAGRRSLLAHQRHAGGDGAGDGEAEIVNRRLTPSAAPCDSGKMITESDVLKQAMELSAPQRCAIAERLLESLEPADAPQNELDDAWSVEIEKRAAAYDRGETQSLDGREAIDRIRRSIQRGDRDLNARFLPEVEAEVPLRRSGMRIDKPAYPIAF